MRARALAPYCTTYLQQSEIGEVEVAAPDITPLSPPPPITQTRPESHERNGQIPAPIPLWWLVQLGVILNNSHSERLLTAKVDIRFTIPLGLPYVPVKGDPQTGKEHMT